MRELRKLMRQYARVVRTAVVWFGRRMCSTIVRTARRCVVDGSTSIGVDIRCQLLLLTRWLLPNRVHGLVQDEWQGATRLRFDSVWSVCTAVRTLLRMDSH